ATFLSCRSTRWPRRSQSPLFPYTPLFRSRPRRAVSRSPGPVRAAHARKSRRRGGSAAGRFRPRLSLAGALRRSRAIGADESVLRSEEHTSELQSRFDLVCRLLLEKKK